MRPYVITPLILAFAPMFCHAQTKCPWMNDATAGGVLGGTVAVNVKTGAHGAGVCEFSRKEGAAVHELRIAVEMMTDVPKQFPSYIAQCPSNTPLRAIGNEAVTCTVEKKGDYTEKVVGRVREQAFVISVSSNVPDDASMTAEMRRHKAHRVAEQVAGILF